MPTRLSCVLITICACSSFAWSQVLPSSSGEGTPQQPPHRAIANREWPQFRGPNSSGLAAGPSPPVEFGPGRNELWRVALNAGHSSPCIAGDAIFLTTYDEQEQRLSVVCIARSSGTIRWERDVPTDHIEKGHPSFNPASSTPASDGERVVAYFGSFGLICFDLNGQKLWEFRMPLAKSFGGNAASPIIVEDRVFLYRGTYVDHFLLALDKATGAELWRVPLSEPIDGEMACTACPIVAGEKLIVHTARSVQAIDASSGNQIWIAKCATTATSTPVLSANEVIVAAWNKMGEPALRPTFPTFQQLIDNHDKDADKRISRDEFPTLWIFHRPEGAEAPQNGATIGFDQADGNKDREITADEWDATTQRVEAFRKGYDTHGILALPINAKGQVGADQVRTLETQGIPEVPSPVCDGDYVYLVKNGGILTCLELATGRRVYPADRRSRNALRVARDRGGKIIHGVRRRTHHRTDTRPRPPDSIDQQHGRRRLRDAGHRRRHHLRTHTLSLVCVWRSIVPLSMDNVP